MRPVEKPRGSGAQRDPDPTSEVFEDLLGRPVKCWKTS